MLAFCLYFTLKRGNMYKCNSWGDIMNNDFIYIFGHKNPDTDSICASIALSYLKNKLGFYTIPSTLGDINSETKYALDYFKVKTPFHLNDVKLQLKDVNYHRGVYEYKDRPIKEVFDYMNSLSLTGIPIVDSRCKYYGYISLKEIAKEIINGDFHKINTSYENILSILNGEKVLKFDKEISGNVMAVTYAKETFFNTVTLDSSSILIVGDRKPILEYAINNKVKLIIIVANLKLPVEFLIKAKKNKVNIISTPFNSYEVGKNISLSNYVGDFIRKEGSVTFNEADYLSDFLDASKKLKHTNYPILGKRNECMGLLTLTDTNDVFRKKVILVDHNNASQSVDGLEEAEIIEVVDHHNIGDIITKKPINFRNAAYGSVNTIIYDLYKENNIEIPKEIAGLMASAIISDTLLLTSPTTTMKDRVTLTKLSEIAGVDYEDYGNELLKHGMSIKGLSIEQLLYKDFKSYKVNEQLVGIGQVLTSDFNYLKKKLNEMVKYFDQVAEDKNYKVLTLFITDIFENKSYIIYSSKSEEIIKESFKLDSIYEGVSLNNILSRKSQIVPYIMDTLESL